MSSTQIQQKLPFKIHKNYRQEINKPSKKKRIHKLYQQIKPAIQTRRQEHLRLKKQRLELKKRQKEDIALNTIISLVQIDSQSAPKEGNGLIDLLAYQVIYQKYIESDIEKDEQIALSQSNNFIQESEQYLWPVLNQ